MHAFCDEGDLVYISGMRVNTHYNGPSAPVMAGSCSAWC